MLFDAMTPSAIIIASAVVVLLLGSCGEVSSWVLPPSPSIIKIQRRAARDYYSRSTALAAESSRPGIFFEDELDCPDEEGCEIDWSSMPGFGEDEETTAVVESPSTTIVNSDDPDCPEEEECEIDWSMMPGFGDDEDEDETAEETTAVVESHSTTIINSDDPDCPEEEECEIDWSMMPGFGDDEDEDETAEENTVAAESPSTTIFNSDDPDCPEEEECEIDWSMMPGFGDDEDEDETEKEKGSPNAKAQNSDTSSASIKGTTTRTRELEYNYQDAEINEKLDELEPQEAYVRQVKRSIEKSRTYMEMNWQIADCVVDKDTCIDPCSDCAGSGKVHCMFCRGTGTIALGDEFRFCILCKGSLTDCKACAGTGSIASWAKTHDGSS